MTKSIYEDGAGSQPAIPDLSRICLPDILLRIASFLPSNVVSCILRVVNRDLAELFHDTRVATLTHPVPPAMFAGHWSSPQACRGLTLPQRLQLVCLTAASGVSANLDVALAAAGCTLTMAAIEAAAAADMLEALQWLVASGRLDYKLHAILAHAFVASASAGATDVCEWCAAPGSAGADADADVDTDGALPHEAAAVAAAKGGHEGLMHRLLERSPGWRSDRIWAPAVLAAAAEGCELPALQHLWEAAGGLAACSFGSDRDSLLDAALASSKSDWHDKCIWLQAQGAGSPSRSVYHQLVQAVEGAAAVERLEWAAAHGLAPPPGALCGAVARGQTHALRWLLDRGLPVNEELIWHPPQANHMEVLDLLDERGCRYEHARYGWARAAAGQGCLPVLRRLLGRSSADAAVQLPDGFLEQMLEPAARGGSAEVLRWLLESGCVLGDEPSHWSAAAASGCEEALALVAEQGWPAPADGQAYVEAAHNGDLRTLGLLRHRLGLPLGPSHVFTQAVWGGVRGAPLGALEWMRREGFPVDWGEAVEAAQERAVDGGDEAGAGAVLAWVREQAREASG